jgi:hypothetical protein
MMKMVTEVDESVVPSFFAPGDGLRRVMVDYISSSRDIKPC